VPFPCFPWICNFWRLTCIFFLALLFFVYRFWLFFNLPSTFSSIILVSLRLVHFHFHLIATFSTIILHNKVEKYKCICFAKIIVLILRYLSSMTCKSIHLQKFIKLKQLTLFSSFHYTKKCKCKMHCNGFHKMLKKSYTQQTWMINIELKNITYTSRNKNKYKSH
jgi:hypothetical protein